MIRTVLIVEGYGDIQAVPFLLGRTASALGQLAVTANPIRAGEWSAIKAKGSLPKFLELANSRGCDLILLCLDLDDGCPIAERKVADAMIDDWRNGRDTPVEVVFFAREYETLFLHTQHQFLVASGTEVQRHPNQIRDAKGALRQVISRRYRETQDQVAFTKIIDLKLLFERSREYRRFCKAISGESYDAIQEAIGR